eukprot:TRINITY_DN3939_c0_g1_i3.p4 TRINITY_DN3939_c0_g1~~TRINITY_DN3939_c0_g1_i3.p4  ORF type:complete len:110 (+),score=6.19 TRINITY_DN3939_c0_g1_i3:339-668(+)
MFRQYIKQFTYKVKIVHKTVYIIQSGIVKLFQLEEQNYLTTKIKYQTKQPTNVTTNKKTGWDCLKKRNNKNQISNKITNKCDHKQKNRVGLFKKKKQQKSNIKQNNQQM